MTAAALERRFSAERFVLLLRNRLLDDAPAFAVASAAVFGFKLLALVVGHAPPSDGWPLLIGIGGVLLAGRAFERMHDGRGASDWLLLPASPLEKYAAAFAAYLAVYPVVAVAAAALLSALLSVAALLLGSGGAGLWNPLAAKARHGWESYFLLAVFALAGSARFRKIPLVKTAAVGIAWMVLLGALGMGLLFFLNGHGRPIFVPHGRFPMRGIDLPPEKAAVLEYLSTGTRAAAFVLAAAYGYFRVAEKEAVDEVQ
jgi:hypothetical protein